MLVADGGELGCAARVCAALPLRDGDEVHGYLVLAFERALSRSVERNDRGGARPLVKVYTRKELRQLFDGFEDVEVLQRQLVRDEVPAVARWIPMTLLERLMGWNLIVKGRKPAR